MKHFGSLLAILVLALSLACCNNAGKQASSQPKAPESEQASQPQQPVIGEAGKAQVVDFYATWCGPCKALAPILEKLEKTYGDKIVFTRIDIDQHPELAEQYEIEVVPTLLYVEASGKITKVGGLAEEQEIENNLKALIGK